MPFRRKQSGITFPCNLGMCLPPTRTLERSFGTQDSRLKRHSKQAYGISLNGTANITDTFCVTKGRQRDNEWAPHKTSEERACASGKPSLSDFDGHGSHG